MRDKIIDVQLAPACLGCADFDYKVDDRTETMEMGAGKNYGRYLVGKCTFTCSHFNVCKRVIDSDKILTLTEVAKN